MFRGWIINKMIFKADVFKMFSKCFYDEQFSFFFFFFFLRHLSKYDIVRLRRSEIKTSTKI